MASINPVSSLSSAALQGLGGNAPLQRPGGLPAGGLGKIGGTEEVAGGGFGDLLNKVVDTVQTRQSEATEATRAVLAGETDQVHKAVIAMQESSVAFTMMVETRNRLVESYQELMRMPV
jgi:flagellar hook-basal body complex protein FliE